jgi:hypothetical protein
MLAPNMGEIKKHRPERRKVTTMGVGRERNYATEMKRRLEKIETIMPLHICKTSSCDCEP